MEHIPVKFQYQNKTFVGHFSRVAGTGDGAQFHLMDSRNFYCGRLRYNSFLNSWVFDESSPGDKLSALVDFFADYITCWYQ